ncbi:MAG: SDR family NAD(P)-dependent oxidoreductase [Solirubrobacterales bacterium]|nr:SDR family NAD(P)-dependent oxidoreductase [Solirubrobacterales bacterium]
MTPLSGRILITGAAGGLGQAIATAAAPQAGSLVLSARRLDQVETFAAGLGAEVLCADMESRSDVENLVRSAGQVDVAILNAALPASGDLMEYEIDQIDRAIEVNLRAPAVMARLLAEGMAERGSGHIVFISSLAGKAASAGTAMYSATKFGLRGLSLALRADLADTGVGVSVICPGFVSDAGMFADSGAHLGPGMNTVTPEKVAEATLRAVEKNQAQVDVAPLALRLGANFAQVAPAAYQAATKRLGGSKLSEVMAEQQRPKR